MAKKTFTKLNITSKDGNTYKLDSVTSEQLNEVSTKTTSLETELNELKEKTTSLETSQQEKAGINDEQESSTSAWSSQKTSSEISKKAAINDESQSQTSVYSSQKVTELIAAKDGYVTEFEENTAILTIKQG